MSRHEIRMNRHEITSQELEGDLTVIGDPIIQSFVYGYDRPMQTYFWQLYDYEGNVLEDEGGITPISGGDLLTAIHKYGLEDTIDKDHITAMVMDLPIE